MSIVGKYCKAYTVDDLRQFSGWSAAAQEIREPPASVTTQDAEETDLSDVLFLQENYVVTTGIFLDEGVVFDKVSPEWIEFCRNTLKFEVPVTEQDNGNSSSASSSNNN